MVNIWCLDKWLLSNREPMYSHECAKRLLKNRPPEDFYQDLATMHINFGKRYWTLIQLGFM